MKTATAIVALAMTGVTMMLLLGGSQTQTEMEFSKFLSTYSKGYTNGDEYSFRLGVFESNLKKIDELNTRNPSAHFAVNKFADRTEQEMQKMMGVVVPEHRKPTKSYRTNRRIDGKSVDWTDMWDGVKNQKSCGSCWAFSAAGAFEARYALKNGLDKVQELFSEQELVDCVDTCYGCNGGFMDYAFQYLTGVGFCHEDQYEYTAVDGTCRDSICDQGPRDTGFHDVPDDQEDELLKELLNGPVAVAVDASNWSFYESGIFSDCDVNLNHGVVLVESNFDKDYVKIRNSWGEDWGENGYIKLALGQDACGYADAASVPTF